MSNALAVVTPFGELMVQADTLIKSGFLPQSVKTKEQAVAIMTMGQEVGIGMWAAFNGISVIQGKPTMGPQLMLALIRRSGQLEDMTIDATDERAVVMMKRKGQTPHTVTFGKKQAQDMGLGGKDNYRKQPAVMFQWRAVSACARVVFPDVVLGFYLPEEINPNVVIDESGEWDRQSYYDAPHDPRPQLQQPEYQDYEDEPEAPADEAQNEPQDNPPSEFDTFIPAPASIAPAGDIGDLLDLRMRDCTGQPMARIKSYSKANSDVKHAIHWDQRFKFHFQGKKAHELDMTVRDFIELMATSHKGEGKTG